MTKTATTTWTDEDDDHVANIEACLSSEAWLKVRGTTKGDLPGETLADTFRRELAWLQAKERNSCRSNCR